MPRTPERFGANQIEEVAALVKAGGVVGHATEGVWGLACDPFNDEAVRKILALKNRPASKGLIVIAAQASALSDELDHLSEDVRRRVMDSWPAAITWLLPTTRFSDWVSGGTGKIAARVPDHEQARALARAAGGLLVSTSLNPAGCEPALDIESAASYFPSLDGLLSGKLGGRGSASTLQDALTGEVLRA